MSQPVPDRWHLITGEYPPQGGGIGDYSALVASGLGRTGAVVKIWTSGTDQDSSDQDGVTVHRGLGGWSRADLIRLGRSLDESPAPRTLLVQYAPNSWGQKGMNLDFGRWLNERKRLGDRIVTMFHEVWYIPGPADTRLIRRLLPWVQRPMARRVLAASDQVFVSTPHWADLLRPIDPRSDRPLTWLPVPSTIPVVDDPSGVAELRIRLAPNGQAIVGNFGTFSNAVGARLAEVLPEILRSRPSVLALLIGRNGGEFANRLIAEHPELSGRIIATGELTSTEVSRHLQACDLMVQPYPDGICGRRTTFMASLAHRVAAITTDGAFTAPDWRGSVAMAPEQDPRAFVRLASELLDDPEKRDRVAQAGVELYKRRFAIDLTIEALLGESPANPDFKNVG